MSGNSEEMQAVLAKLQPHALPAITITPLRQAPAHPESSKFGGLPWWPRGMAYPRSAAGAPLYLLAQLNLAELPVLAGFPRQGLLQFFVANDDVYGLDFDRPLDEVLSAPDGYRVVYHAEVDPQSALPAAELPPLPEENCLPLQAEYALRFTAVADLPAPSDYRFEAIACDIDELDDSLIDRLYDLGLGTGSKLGGYAYFTQEDPRAYERRGEAWQLLFQMDTHDEDDGVEIMWGDCGVGNFFIEAERLAQGDFSRVWYNWDCC